MLINPGSCWISSVEQRLSSDKPWTPINTCLCLMQNDRSCLISTWIFHEIKVDESCLIKLNNSSKSLISYFVNYEHAWYQPRSTKMARQPLIKHDTSTANNIHIKHEQDCCQLRSSMNTDRAGHLNHDQVWYQAWTRLMSTTIKYDINTDRASQLNHDQAWSIWAFLRVYVRAK